jgi:signal transduction histidine kinase
MSSSWWRWPTRIAAAVPRRGVRVRLTLLFAGLFLVAGAGLLGITYGLLSHATDSIIMNRVAAGSTLPSQSISGGPTVIGPILSTPAPDSSAAGAGTAVGPLAGLSPEQAGLYVSGTRAAENDALLLYFGIALGIMAVLSAALGWFAAGRALRPLRRITAAARRISATNLNERLAINGPDDDLRELADTIDDLFGRLDASLLAQRQFVANASHELRTPLARSRTVLEVALRDPGASAQTLRATCERAIAAGAEQERLIEALLTLARGERGLARRDQLDLAVVTRDALSARGTEVTARRLSMESRLAPAFLLGDQALIERTVANLVDNALRHNVPDGTATVSVESDGGRAVLCVSNTGPEILPTDVGRLLLPFQRGGAERTRPRPGPDAGLGLGLSIVSAIATAHGAALSVTPRLTGGGLTVRLAFPAPPDTWPPPEEAAHPAEATLGAEVGLDPERRDHASHLLHT